MATSRVEPPTGVVSARFGGSYIFAGYSRVLRQWYWIIPGGEEKIAAPEMIFVEDDYVRTHTQEASAPLVNGKGKRAVQLALPF